MAGEPARRVCPPARQPSAGVQSGARRQLVRAHRREPVSPWAAGPAALGAVVRKYTLAVDK